MTAPPLVLTTGEPAGVGPELTVQLLQQPFPGPLVIVCDPDFLRSSGAVQSIAGDTVQRALGLPTGVSGRRWLYLPLGVRGKTEKR